MQSGILIVTGSSETYIPLNGLPHDVVVEFKDIDPSPCNHHHHHPHDHLEYRIDHIDENSNIHRNPEHHHHDRQFILFIKWTVSSVREIFWYVN